MNEQPWQTVYRLRMQVGFGKTCGPLWVTHWHTSPADVMADLQEERPVKYTVQKCVLNEDYTWLPCSEVMIDKAAVFDGGASSGKWVMLPEEDRE